MIKITEAAIDKLDALLPTVDDYVRISIQGGGCSGMEYKFEITSIVEEGDQIVDEIVLVDPISIQYMEEVEIDYIESIQASQFVIRNPKATGSCGCGSSFSV
jgi:iron-sulfur cluster assembly accessory protein